MKKILLILLVIVSFGFACRSEKNDTGPFSGNAIIYWEKDQRDLSRPERIWHGFDSVDGRLEARKKDPVLFFFWNHTPASERLSLIYRKISPGRLTMKLNGEELLFIDRSTTWRRINKHVSSLRRGINFLTFAGPAGGFVIRSLTFENQKLNDHILGKGEALTISGGAGEISLSLKGKSRIKLEFTDFPVKSGPERREEEEISTSLPFHRLKIRKQTNTSFLLRIECLEGSCRFEEGAFQARENAPSLLEPPATRNRNPDIFIFLWDACQAKHLKLYGYHRDTAPNIRKLAEDAVVFRTAYSNSSYTAASVTSLFTGLYPAHHGRMDIQSKLSPKILTMGEFFKKKEYSTALFTTNANVSFSSGLGKGIDHFQRLLDVYIKNESQKVVDAFTDWVQKTNFPRFAYLHFMEPHFPLIPPPPFLNQYKKKIVPKEKTVIRHLTEKDQFTPEEVQDVIDDYDSDINFVDHLLGNALDYLKKKGCYDESLIIVLADHGEACYEHKAWGHDQNVYEETNHIPLVIKFPRSANIKGDVWETAQIIDIFPTLQQWVSGESTDFDSQGLPGITPDETTPNATQPVFIQGFPEHGLFAVRWSHWYYIFSIQTLKEELYDLSADPLTPQLSEPNLSMFLRGRLMNWLRDTQRRAAEPINFDINTLPPEEIENLKTLGYL